MKFSHFISNSLIDFFPFPVSLDPEEIIFYLMFGGMLEMDTLSFQNPFTFEGCLQCI